MYHSHILRARFAACFFLLPTLLHPADLRTRNIILVTADGLRWQDLFHGIDPLLAREKSVSMDPSSKDADARRARFVTRESLAPFFWRTIAENAVVLNNVNVTNAYRVSYPGYSEILTGRASDDIITGNIDVQQPNENILEFLKRKLSLPKDRVALFSSWDHFQVHRGTHPWLHRHQRRLSGFARLARLQPAPARHSFPLGRSAPRLFYF